MPRTNPSPKIDHLIKTTPKGVFIPLKGVYVYPDKCSLDFEGLSDPQHPEKGNPVWRADGPDHNAELAEYFIGLLHRMGIQARKRHKA